MLLFDINGLFMLMLIAHCDGEYFKIAFLVCMCPRRVRVIITLQICVVVSPGNLTAPLLLKQCLLMCRCSAVPHTVWTDSR